MWWKNQNKYKYMPFEFVTNSSLHGVKYVCQPGRHWFERIFWLLVSSLSIGVASIFITEFWNNFFGNPVVNTFTPSQTPISAIPFPAVTICNVNNALRWKAEEIISTAENSTVPSNALEDLYQLTNICLTSKSFSKIFGFTKQFLPQGLQDKLEEYINTRSEFLDERKTSSGFLKTVSQNCSDMIRLCYWAHDEFDCSELFTEIETDYGLCCRFNGVPLSLLLTYDESKSKSTEPLMEEWRSMNLSVDALDFTANHIDGSHIASILPRRQLKSGKSYGLSIILDPDVHEYFCTNTDSQGFQVRTDSPLNFPTIQDYGTPIAPNTEVFMNIYAQINMADIRIKGRPLPFRNCYFATEFPLQNYNYYTQANCVNECLANATFDHCNCVKSYMPKRPGQAICSPEDVECNQNLDMEMSIQGVYEACPQCLPLCNQIIYNAVTASGPLRQDLKLWRDQNGELYAWNADDITVLHVYFAVDAIYPIKREEHYDTVDLFSNTGGLLSLFLGFSVLSLLEIVYFLTIRLICKKDEVDLTTAHIPDVRRVFFKNFNN